MLNSKGSEKLTTDRIGWSTLNDICGKENKKVSESYRKLEYYTGKMGLFYIWRYQKQDKMLKK